MEAAAEVAKKVARCPRCKAQVEVKTMKSLLLLDEPDENVDVYATHSEHGMRCEGSRTEIDP